MHVRLRCYAPFFDVFYSLYNSATVSSVFMNVKNEEKHSAVKAKIIVNVSCRLRVLGTLGYYTR